MDLVEEICCVLSDKMFEVFSPIWSHVNENLAKIQNLKFHQSLYNFGRDPMHELFGVNLLRIFRGDVV